jgi:hypothetical protein
MMVVVMTVRPSLDLSNRMNLRVLGRLFRSFWHRLFW